MLLETITFFLPIFSLTCLVCLWSDFDIVSYSLLSYKYLRDTYIDTLVCICSCMSVILSVFILGILLTSFRLGVTQYADVTSNIYVTCVGVGCLSRYSIQLWQ